MRLTFGLGLYTGQRPPGSTAGPLYRDAIALAEAAEAAGFDAFWVSEHHGFLDSYLPSPLTVLAAIAARTDRIRLATGVLVAPFAHPLHLAEDAAVVDQVSDGRLLLGLGLGYAVHEYQAFGVDRTARGAALADLVAFLRTAWRGEQFDWDGPCGRGRGLRVTPRPVQDPVPIWLGGYAATAVRRAARIAEGYLLGRADDDIVVATHDLLASQRMSAGAGFTFGLNVITAFADDPADAAAARAGLAYQQSTYDTVQVGGIAHAGRVATASAPVSAETVDAYVHVSGDPATIAARMVDKLAPISAWPSIHLVVRALFPEPDLRRQVGRVERLGAEVLPRIRAAVGGDAA
ncbi:MAG: LLM class flavin-dependent oxidoreductase [Betaproteobacteria bacterium]